MLSRREKLLIRPWINRRYAEHRKKVELALPAIDDAKPPSRNHVTVKLKKNQFELERKEKIQKDNFCLIQRLESIMKVNRLDNHWEVPLPNFYPRVGLFFPREQYESTLYSPMTEATEEDVTATLRKDKCKACQAKKQAKLKKEFAIQLPMIESKENYMG